MSKIYETGNVINIANFKSIINLCINLGAKYNPSNPDISIAGMTAKWSAAEALHEIYLVKLMATKNPINDREDLFKKMKSITVRSSSFYYCSQSSDLNKESVKALVRKITGSNVHRKKLADGRIDPKHKSNSHLSYEVMTDNFATLISWYKNDANYLPNEADLTIASLDVLLGKLTAANSLVGRLMAEKTVAMNDRDKALFTKVSGIVDVSLACKKYVRALFGVKSEEAKAVSGILVKRMKSVS